MIDTVIFDMDGVIVDSELYWKETEKLFIKKIAPKWNEKEHNKLVGLNIIDMYDVLKKIGLTIDKKSYLEQYDKLAESIYNEKTSLLPGFLEFFEKLKEDNFKTALASSSPVHWINMVVERFELSFDKVISGHEAPFKSKPNPDIFLFTAKQLNKNPEYCVVIEDSKNGVVSAKSAGMKCIGMCNGFNDEQDLSKADLIINNFSELSAG